MAKQLKTKLNLLPTAGYIIIDPTETTKQTASGIYLPDSHDEKPQKGVVVAVGSDELLDNGSVRKSPVKVGDTVIYKKWGGDEIKVDGKEYLFSKFENILAIVN